MWTSPKQTKKKETEKRQRPLVFMKRPQVPVCCKDSFDKFNHFKLLIEAFFGKLLPHPSPPLLPMWPNEFKS